KLTAPEKISVPGDISSAAYWLVLATILDGSDVTIKNVGVNDTRTGILDVLKLMGAQIELLNERISGGERAADLRVVSSKIHGVEFGGKMIPRLIDEIPALAVAAAFAEGTTIIRDVGELRVKETDRLAAIVEEFNKISPATFTATDESLIIRGGGEKFFAECKTRADHRMAMSLAIFGAAAKGVAIDDADCVKISYPNFFDTLK
ncbi:MAG: 3-phosphoshikimate 1-carboxyvinyltransferase, partial [Selenomonadaceae bacterium]|nr:3-phosphoshikimate 1-carboxyvinyltransferase [Selenomonadaceae bacterium]